jgi:hypothetical protein
MNGSPMLKKIDELMDKASEALVQTAYFEAERLTLKALAMAHEERDFERMARIILPLQESRRLRLQQALDVGSVTVISDVITEEYKAKRGCFLVQPPQVGADARRIRMISLRDEVPVAVICREPLTRTKLCPIVAISPGFTVRARVQPPARLNQPDLPWFIAALEALGDSAIESLDPAMDVERRIEGLLIRLDAASEHERLHQALMATCREAQHALGPSLLAASQRTKSKAS